MRITCLRRQYSVGEGNKEVRKLDITCTGMPHALFLLCLLPARSRTDPNHADSFGRAQPALPELLFATAVRPTRCQRVRSGPGSWHSPGTAGTAPGQPWDSGHSPGTAGTALVQQARPRDSGPSPAARGSWILHCKARGAARRVIRNQESVTLKPN